MLRTRVLAALTTALVTFSVFVVRAQTPAIWADSFSVSAGSFDANSEYNNGTRQSGVLSPISYAQSPAGADYHHQVIAGNAPLLLVGDSTATGKVSPNYNFTNVAGVGVLDSVNFTMWLNDLNLAGYAWASFSLGGGSQNIEADAATPHFGIKFIRDTIFGGGNVMQFFDGNTWIGGINYSFPNDIDPGAGYFNVLVTITNSTGGNPWIGVGTTTIKVYVNGSLVTSYSKVGGYTNNYLTLQGGWGASDATHIVLNRTIVGTFKVGVPPAAPTGLAAAPDCGAIVLNWLPSAGTKGYKVKRSTMSGLETLLGTTSGTNFSDGGALPGTNYYYVVSATNNAGESANSAEVSATWNSATSNALLLTFDFGAPLGKATIVGTNVMLRLAGPIGPAVTNLTPTYNTVSACATGVPASGSSHDFTTPQTYTITAPDGSAKVYTVAVSINVPPVNPYRILPVGDSITVGYMGNTWTTLNPYGCGYRGPLYTLLANFGLPVQYVGNSPQPDPGTLVPTGLDLRVIGQDHHEAYGGKDTAYVLTNINNWVTTNTPDIVLLMIGINDIGQGSTGEPTTTENNLSNIVNQIVSQTPNTRVVVAQITPYSTYTAALIKYNDYIRNTLVPSFVAQGKHVTTVNQYTNLLVAGTTNIDASLFSNGINHPNTAVYSRMAQTWFQGVQALGLAVPPVPLPATGRTVNSAVLNAALTCPGTNYDVYAYWNTVKGGASPALWTNSALVGSWTNVTSTNLSYTATGLVPGTTYYFTFRATNAVSDLWAASVLSFTTLAARPGITSVTLAGSNLVMNGQNGMAGLTYTTMMSTNVALPLIQWTPVASNVLAVSGNFTIVATNAVSPSAAQQFYLLKTP